MRLGGRQFLLLMHFHKAGVFLKPENPPLHRPRGFRHNVLAMVDLENQSADLAKKFALRFALGLKCSDIGAQRGALGSGFRPLTALLLGFAPRARLDREPGMRWAGTIGCVPLFRDDASEPQPRTRSEQGFPILEMFHVAQMGIFLFPDQFRKPRLSLNERRGAQILLVRCSIGRMPRRSASPLCPTAAALRSLVRRPRSRR